MLSSIGFTQGKASARVPHHRKRRIKTFVRGDDYVNPATSKQLQWLKERLEHKSKIKTQWSEPGKGYQQEVRILNRIVAWDTANGIVFEVESRHAEVTIEQLKLKDANVV